MTNPTTQLAFKNNTGSSKAYVYVTGLDINKNNAYAFLRSDGKTMYYPDSPSQPQTPLSLDPAIPLGAPGTTTTVTIPQLAGGRIWIVVDAKLTFLLNPGPGIVEPAVTNKADPNYNLKWGFCEFTYNKQQLFVNISYVDFVSLPIALELRNTEGKTQTVKGLPTDGLDRIATQLAQQASSENPDWGKLIIKGADGKNLRVLSPNGARVADNSVFKNYYQPYVDEAWNKYKTTDLKIDTQAQWGVVTGRVGSDGLLKFENAGSFAKPSAGDIFSCDTGPFGNYPEETRIVQGAIGARLAASLNRSTLVSNPNQPDPAGGSNTYYRTSPTNHYARIVHGVNLDGRGYAFPYDDVAPNGDSSPDQAGTVFDGSPELLTVTFGGPAARQGRKEQREDVQEPVVGGGKAKKDKKAGIDFAGFFKKIASVVKGLFHK